jgi:CDP-diacylglycerol--glycerol-3-phosphate 3-phosphatidyltransferase
MIRHLPNVLSLSRIGLGAALFFILRLGTPAATVGCVGIMLLSMLTDYLDGKLARRTKSVSVLGKWIDPLSDFSFFLFVYLSFFRLGLMPLPLLILFLTREVIMYTVVRPLSTVRGLDPAAKLPGKLKTVFQIVGTLAIMALILAGQLGILERRILPLVSVPLLSLLVAVSVASVYWYVRPLFRRRPRPTATMRQVVVLIVGSTIACYLAQTLYYGLILVLYHLPLARLYLFLSVSAGYHVLFLLALLVVRREFSLERDRSLLVCINVPLALSFLRFSSIPTVIFLFVSRQQIVVAHALAPFLAFMFLTDFFDGIIARRFNTTTRIGRILDASGDYVLIVVLSVLFVTGGLIPVWLFVLVLVRLLVQAVGIIVLYFLRGYSVLRLSFLGKASIFAVFTLYGFEMFELMAVPVIGWSPLVNVLEFLTAGVLLAALAEKLVFLVRGYSVYLRNGRPVPPPREGASRPGQAD